MRPNFFVNTPDILHAFLQYGGPPAFKIRAVARRDRLPELGRLRRLRALRARRGQAGQRGVPRLGEVPDPDPRLGRGRGRGPVAGAVPHAAQRRPPCATPRCSSCATCTIHSSDDDAVLVFSKHATGTAEDDDIVIVVVNLDPHGTRETMVHLDLPALGLDWNDTFAVHDEITGQDLALGRAQLRAARPLGRARPRAHREEHRVTGADPAPCPEGDRPSAPEPDRRHARLVQDRGLLRGAGALVQRLQRRRRRRLPRASPTKLDYLHWLGVDCLWVPPFFSSPLRDGGYDVADYTNILPEVRHGRGLPRVPRRGAHARHPGDHRLRHEPHQRPAPVVPGQPGRPGRALRRLLRVVRHRRALRGSARHLRRHRAVELDLGPGPPAVLLAPVLLPPARPELRQPQGPRRDARGDELLARHGPRRLPARRRAVPLRAARHQRREPAGDPRVPQARCAATSTTTTPGGCCWPRPTSGRPTSSTTSATRAGRRRRVPHVLPLPGDAAHLHGRTPRVRATRSRRSSSRPRRSPTAASGASSCATTTS